MASRYNYSHGFDASLLGSCFMSLSNPSNHLLFTSSGQLGSKLGNLESNICAQVTICPIPIKRSILIQSPRPPSARHKTAVIDAMTFTGGARHISRGAQVGHAVELRRPRPGGQKENPGRNREAGSDPALHAQRPTGERTAGTGGLAIISMHDFQGTSRAR